MSEVPRVVRNDWSQLHVPELGGWRPTLPVSVVIPAHDCQPSLDLTLASLTRQTYPANLTEVIVVDDGSRPRLRLPTTRPTNTQLVWAPDHTDDWGIASACNVGVRKSAGNIILRLDADMIVVPHHIEAHARWHHEIPYAVTLGSKRFADMRPDLRGWPLPEDIARGNALERMFPVADTEPHGYVEKLINQTDQLRAADHVAFLALVGATVAVRREMYDAAGGFDATLRRGSDTEFGYRLAQMGALFVPERSAGGWHLGPSSMMRDRLRLQRYSRPFLADLMPHPRWLRNVGGSGWAVPLVTVFLEVDGHPLELFRAAVDAVLGNDERDLRVLLVGGWDQLVDERRSVLLDPLLDLRLIATTFRSDPRVRLVDRVPDTAFPSPYLIRLPVTAGLARSAIRLLVDEADRHQAGLVRVASAGGCAAVELWRTAALGRTRWVRRDGESLETAVATMYCVRTLKAAAAGVVDLSRIPPERLAESVRLANPGSGLGGWLPATVEVGGLRSWTRATAVVALLAARRAFALVRRIAPRSARGSSQ